MFGRRHEELERELRARITLLERCLDEQADRERTVHLELEKLRARYLEAEKRADIAQNNFEWARVRLNQIEEERATLIAALIKTPIGALEIQRRLTPDQGEGLPHVPDGLFDDVGDDAAHALGLSADEVTTHA